MKKIAQEPPPLWHTLNIAQTFEAVGSAPEGLAGTEAGRRLAQHGINEIEPGRGVSVPRLLLSQFKSVLVLVLCVAIGMAVYLGHQVEAAVIGVIVFLAAALGFAQEFRAERALLALRQMAAPLATVLRDGRFIELPACDLVPGDVVRLQTGNRVPADLRLLEAANLRIDEAPLTGESVPVAKQVDALADAQLALADRANLAYAGTAVTYGRGCGIVVATGMGTEFGRIVGLLRGAGQPATPLQKSLDRVGKVLAGLAMLIVAAVVAAGLERGAPLHDMLLFGIALAVAVVPEALPAVVAISLAIGARRMAKRHALIRRLPAVETLGATSVICSDKTGTLTKGEMTVRKLWVAGKLLTVTGVGYDPVGRIVAQGAQVPLTPPLLELFGAMALANDAELVRVGRGRWEVRGDPSEGALLVAFAKAGLKKPELDARYPRVGEIPFTSETKCMTTLHADPDGGQVAYTKGALEVVLDACTHWLAEEGERALDAATRALIHVEAGKLAEQAQRVLAVARKKNATPESARRGLCFLGLAGMIDPPRPESKTALATCEQAGIKVVMITGDHPLTARTVARELGILRHGRVVSGAELDAMDDDALEQAVGAIEVYARVAPEHKSRVVAAWQRRGRVVAMTGDGVNDAPALRQADIGIAMGLAGTDVSREAADMVLADDNFASIVAAVEEGRGIFGNIKKYLMYLLSANLGEIGLMAGAMLLGMPLPLSAVQILYINLATDGLPALALAFDPLDADLMRQKPRDPKRGVLSLEVVGLMLVGGLWSAAVNLGMFIWSLWEGRLLVEAMTLNFATLTMIEFFKAYNFRSEHHSLFRRPFANRWLNLAVAWELALLLVLVYMPPLREWFGTVPLAWQDWLRVLGAAVTLIPVLELAKWTIRRAARNGREGAF